QGVRESNPCTGLERPYVFPRVRFAVARLLLLLPGCPARIAVARSVDNDEDARWLAQRLHRSFGSSVDVNRRFLGWLLLVVGAGPVELSIAQHNAALGENGTLQFCDSLGIGPIR